MERSRQMRQLHRGVAQLRRQFAQCAGSVLGGAMPEAEVRRVVQEEMGRYRDRIYPPIETLRLFIGQVLSEDRACKEVAGRRLSERVARAKSSCISLNDQLDHGGTASLRQPVVEATSVLSVPR